MNPIGEYSHPVKFPRSYDLYYLFYWIDCRRKLFPPQVSICPLLYREKITAVEVFSPGVEVSPDIYLS